MKRSPLFPVYVLAVACSFLAAVAGFWLLSSLAPAQPVRIICGALFTAAPVLTFLLLPLVIKKPS